MNRHVRPAWIDTWLAMAYAIADRGLCTGRHIGAVITDHANRIISVGYAGPPAGMDKTTPCTNWCPRRLDPPENSDDYSTCYSVHAEINTLLFADRASFAGGTMYVTAPPCVTCARAIANSGLACVVYGYSTELDGHLNHQPSFDIIEKSGLTLIRSHHD